MTKLAFKWHLAVFQAYVDLCITGWKYVYSWLRHQMETFSALLAICARNSPVTGEFPTQRPVTRSFDVFFDLRPNKRLSKQWWGWWLETPSCPLWRHRNVPLALGHHRPPYWLQDEKCSMRWSVLPSCTCEELLPVDKLWPTKGGEGLKPKVFFVNGGSISS